MEHRHWNDIGERAQDGRGIKRDMERVARHQTAGGGHGTRIHRHAAVQKDNGKVERTAQSDEGRAEEAVIRRGGGGGPEQSDAIEREPDPGNDLGEHAGHQRDHKERGPTNGCGRQGSPAASDREATDYAEKNSTNQHARRGREARAPSAAEAQPRSRS